MKPKGVATERKAPSEYILMVLFVQLLYYCWREFIFLHFLIIWSEKMVLKGIKQITVADRYCITELVKLQM